jgi:predicted CxxxxCH...CXXCH cytochrome family protein
MLLMLLAVPAWSADLISNGGFDGATGWTFGGNGFYSTAQSNGTLTGIGSFEATATGRNAALSGTASQAASVLSGAIINSVSLAGMHTWGGIVPANPVTVTVSLRYTDASTVDIFSADLPFNSSWASLTDTLNVLPLTTSQNVNTITVTVTGKNGNNGAAAQSAFIDDIVVDFTSAATDSLTVTSAINVSTTAQPGQTDVQMMYLQLNSDSTGNGNVVVTDVTLNDNFVGTTGTIASVQVHLDDDSNFLNGTLGSSSITPFDGLSTLVDLTSTDLTLAERTVTSGAPKFLWLLYDIEPGSSTGIQAQLQVTDVGVVAPDIAPISGPWESNIIDINTGLGCGGCHPNPMIDGIARDPFTGGVVGDHTKHASVQGYDCNLCHLAIPLTPRHRNELIEMRLAIGDVPNARYDKDGDHVHDANWQQIAVPDLGNCENTACHGGINNVTSYGGPTGLGPQWGGTNADTCTFCHNANQTNAGGVANAYPTDASPFRSAAGVGAHAVHMAGAGGLMSGGVLCDDCHTVPALVTDAGHMDELGVAPYTQAPADVPFPVGSDARLAGYAAIYDDATVTCNVYCHSAFDAATVVTKGTATQPLWTADWANYGADSACATTCHLVPPQTVTHDNGGSWYTLSECNPCHNTSTTDTANPPTMGVAHINGTIDATGCTGCHGTDPKQYPPVSPASGGSDGLGAHVVHIEQTSSIMTKEVNEGTTASDWCAECHTATRGSGGHDDTYPAEVAFTNAIESVYGGTSASIAPDASAVNDGNAGDCTVYCHGANMPKGDTSGTKRTPDWADTALAGACDTCHGAPPTAGSSASAHSGQAFPGSCITCHPDTVLNANNPPTLDPAFHIDGSVQASGCNGCHGGDNATWGNGNFWPSGGTAYPKRPGEHEVHINALISLQGYTAGTITDVQQQGLCDYCHNDANGVGGAGHDDNTAIANVGGFNRIFDGAADGGGAASYTAGNGTGGSCSNIDCHNDNSTPAAFEWYDGATSGCVMCHVAGGSGTVDPLSGIHKPGTLTSSTPHDNNFASGATCTTCHSTMSAFMTGNHGNDVDNGNATANLGLTVGMYTQASTAGNGSGTCSGGSVAAGSCHGIDSIDAGSWARKWDDTISYQTGGGECAGCHGGFSNDWTFGGDNTVGDNNVSHTRDWDGGQSGNDGAEVIGNHSGTTTATRCNICHVYGDAEYVWASRHRNRVITMNGTMGYSGTNFNCSTNCHSESPYNNTDHNLEAASSSNFSTRGELLGGPALACTGCHSGHVTGSAGVGNDSPHSFNSTGVTCEGCHTSHTGGPVTIPNNGTVGIAYSVHTGISLGGSATSGTTEQDICNGCHGASYQPWNITQGGYTTGALSNYSDWDTASWASANFSSYKPTTIQSNHYNQAAGMSCSYCHDVHDTGGTPNTGVGGPYLRGTWTSNPFPEDGAPNTADGNVGGNLHTEDAPEGVPRGLGGSSVGTSNALGGWQIEQNNPGVYTRSGNYGTYAGVCQPCHPADASATGILRGASFSGHAAAVDGLQTGGGNDLFRPSLRGELGTFNGRGNMQHNNMATLGDAGKTYVIGLREGWYGTGIYPQVADPRSTGVTTNFSLTIGSDGVDQNFHEFPCSKCHSPHMSALPRLMITNCLDVRHNTWDDQAGFGNPSAWSGSSSYTAKTLAYSSTAANCHRYVDSSDGNRETNANGGNGEPGWNGVTPW